LGVPVTAILKRRIVHPRKHVVPEISPEAYQKNLKPQEPECPF
jgi:hypothetical protein